MAEAVKYAGEVLAFWFGQSPATAESVKHRSKFWFNGDEGFDREIDRLFAETIAEEIENPCLPDVQDAHQALARVIVLDQFPRNVFRRSARAFAGDDCSLQIARHVLATGRDTELGAVECGFLFMPFQHSESLADQEEGVELFADLVARATDWERSFAESFHKYAGMHRDIVKRFGRFPHRNSVLGRKNTPAEQDYLDGDGHRFGQ